MKKSPRFSPSTNCAGSKNGPKTTLLIFCDKQTGAVQFQARVDVADEVNWVHASNILAIQCLIRSQSPDDFVVLMPVSPQAVTELFTRAKKLLKITTSLYPNALPPRQMEVLEAVAARRSNRDIAARLNITERTVKFHISALLAKFAASNRNELVRKAAMAIESLRPRTRSRKGPQRVLPLEQEKLLLAGN